MLVQVFGECQATTSRSAPQTPENTEIHHDVAGFLTSRLSRQQHANVPSLTTCPQSLSACLVFFQICYASIPPHPSLTLLLDIFRKGCGILKTNDSQATVFVSTSPNCFWSALMDGSPRHPISVAAPPIHRALHHQAVHSADW